MSEIAVATNCGEIIRSPQPLPNKMTKLNNICYACMVVTVVGFFGGFAIAGICALAIAYTIWHCALGWHRGQLRVRQFALNKDIDMDTLFNTMQPIFISKYNLDVTRKENIMTVCYNKHLFDISLEDGQTFSIWWHMSAGKAFMSFNNYKSYKRILAGMGIIAYEIQKAFGVVS